MPDKFDIETALLCEDVREEVRQKFTLVGLYTGDILISQIPGNIPIALFVGLNVKETGEQKLQLRLSGPGDHSAILKTDIDFKKLGSSVLQTPKIDLHVDAEGVFAIDISEDGENWSSVIQKKISLMEGASAS